MPYNVIYKGIMSLKDAKSQGNQLNPSSLQFINWQNTNNYDPLQNEKISDFRARQKISHPLWKAANE